MNLKTFSLNVNFKCRGFWIRVLRKHADEHDDCVRACVCLGIDGGCDSYWNYLSCVQNHGPSTVAFLRNIFNDLGSHRVIVRFCAESIYFDKQVLHQAALAGHLVVSPGVDSKFVMPNAQTLMLDGDNGCGSQFENLPASCRVFVQIRQGLPRYSWPTGILKKIVSLTVFCPACILLYRTWDGYADAMLEQLDVSMGCPLPEGFINFAERTAMHQIPFMPNLKYLGWLQVFFNGMETLRARMVLLTETLFPMMDSIKIYLEVVEPVDMDSLADYQHKETSRKIGSIAFYVWWGIDADERETFLTELSVMATFLGVEIVVF